MTFGERLNMEIKRKKIPRKLLAQRAGIGYRSILNYCHRPCFPKADIAVALAQVLGVTVEYLVTGEQEANHE